MNYYTDHINHIDLRSDLENEVLTDGTFFTKSGWNELPLHLAEQVGDLELAGKRGWIIQAIGPLDGVKPVAYFYTSMTEYIQDWNAVDGVTINTKMGDVLKRLEEMGLRFQKFSTDPDHIGKITQGLSTIGVQIHKEYFTVHDPNLKIDQSVIDLIQKLQKICE